MSYEINQNFQNEEKSTEIIEDYLDLIRCSHPNCYCCKCIWHKYSHNPPNFQYKKKPKSSYKNKFDWKKPDNKHLLGNGRKPIIQNLRFDICFKEYLKNSLVSVIKNDYSKSLKIKEDLLLNNFDSNKLKALNDDSDNLEIKIKLPNDKEN